MNFSLEPNIILDNIENKILNRMTKTELSKKLKIRPQSLVAILKNLKLGGDCRISTLKKIAAAGEIKCEELLVKN
ncbi:hypothetical protein [Fusobacterium mortiferum]|jgi:hypothetical protein|uniref:XRE family transcriptional regulator n=2 Tax=Fusobacterium mortiferum TaxID=850 RepID=A0ABS2FZ35_FUSMR|nr:hypothetical protein [Fusobacterium mortiferum]MBM6874409.1 hypothetical protein [Fusobacterium mortiferum]MCF2699823.1 hypothetical protein [Fusobacterium mortiferum]